MKLTTIFAFGAAIATATASTSPDHATQQITSFTSQPSPSTTSTTATTATASILTYQEKLNDILERGTEKIRVATEKLRDALANACAKERLDALENAEPIGENDNDNANASVNEEQQQQPQKQQQEQPASLIASCSIKMIPSLDKEAASFSTSSTLILDLHPTPEESDEISSILLKTLSRDRSFLLFQDSVAATWEDFLSDEEEEEARIEVAVAVAGDEDGGVEGRGGGSRRTMDH